jgi:hypothetical protein
MLRSLTISHDYNAHAHLPSSSKAMDKDIALVTTTIPDYHDGLREKPVHSKSEEESYFHSEKRVFQVRCCHTGIKVIMLISGAALHQSTCHQ